MKLGKGVLGIAKPQMKDAKTNVFFSVWLFLWAIDYLKKALLIKMVKYQTKWWWKFVSYPFKLFLKVKLPFLYTLKYLKWFRIGKFITMMLGGLIWFTYSPAELAVILSYFAGQMWEYFDALFLLGQGNLTKLVDFLFKKFTEVKPSLDEIKEKRWLPESDKPSTKKSVTEKPSNKWFSNSSEQESQESLRKTYKNGTPIKEYSDQPFYKNPYFIGGCVVVGICIVGGIIYWFYYSDSLGADGGLGKGKLKLPGWSNEEMEEQKLFAVEKLQSEKEALEIAKQVQSDLSNELKEKGVKDLLIQRDVENDHVLTSNPFNDNDPVYNRMPEKVRTIYDHYFALPEEVDITDSRPGTSALKDIKGGVRKRN